MIALNASGRGQSVIRSLMMADDVLGSWDPLNINEVVRLFDEWPARWWITGGVALELHLGRSWRNHDDSDVSILRGDARKLPALLAGWDIQIAAAGTLAPWVTPVLVREGQNNVWCRRATDQPWCLDVTISDGDAATWIYRRDPSLRAPWAYRCCEPRKVFPTSLPSFNCSSRATTIGRRMIGTPPRSSERSPKTVGGLQICFRVIIPGNRSSRSDDNPEFGDAPITCNPLFWVPGGKLRTEH